jgi:hypothetical protein
LHQTDNGGHVDMVDIEVVRHRPTAWVAGDDWESDGWRVVDIVI